MAKAGFAVAQTIPSVAKGLKDTGYPGPPKEGTDDASDIYNAMVFQNALVIACFQKAGK
jgi:hypothetical protein